jgi:hypothetical protein
VAAVPNQSTHGSRFAMNMDSLSASTPASHKPWIANDHRRARARAEAHPGTADRNQHGHTDARHTTDQPGAPPPTG